MNKRLFVSAAFLLAAAGPVMSDPAWWTDGGALSENPPNDHAVVNQGQLKHFTSKAVLELNRRTFEGAGDELDQLVRKWIEGHPDPGDFQAITAGQLKWVAAKIHERLVRIRYEDEFPDWLPAAPPVPPDPRDKELVNIGQLKTVFYFDLSAPTGELAEWWQKLYFGETGIDPDADPDGDGKSNLWEFLHGTNPWAIDTDGDGIPDGEDSDPLKAGIIVAESVTFRVLSPLE